jgi:hypothetical protein
MSGTGAALHVVTRRADPAVRASAAGKEGAENLRAAFEYMIEVE